MEIYYHKSYDSYYAQRPAVKGKSQCNIIIKPGGDSFEIYVRDGHTTSPYAVRFSSNSPTTSATMSIGPIVGSWMHHTSAITDTKLAELLCIDISRMISAIDLMHHRCKTIEPLKVEPLSFDQVPAPSGKPFISAQLAAKKITTVLKSVRDDIPLVKYLKNMLLRGLTSTEVTDVGRILQASIERTDEEKEPMRKEKKTEELDSTALAEEENESRREDTNIAMQRSTLGLPHREEGVRDDLATDSPMPEREIGQEENNDVHSEDEGVGTPEYSDMEWELFQAFRDPRESPMDNP